MTKKKRVLWLVLLVFITFGTYGCAKETTSSVPDPSVQAIKSAGDSVKYLFIQSDWDSLTTARIKTTTTQEQIDHAAKLVSRIKPKGKGDANTFFGLGLVMAIANAQKQLDIRNGKISPTAKQYNPDKNAGQKETAVKQNQNKLPKYIPKKDDVILKNHVLKNKDRLEDFIKNAQNHKESKIRVVKYDELRGALIYDLQSRYDEKVNQGWIDVKPDLNYFRKLKSDTQDVFNNAPQQCGSISKDKENGYYILKECRTNWEYRLLPIINDHERK
ncbi:DUF4362 domain-containing protein [Scopulibacillus darangshiensis]|nr:DUF4362 domain-containing protein [Scopulibacillus darangshiensis]